MAGKHVAKNTIRNLGKESAASYAAENTVMYRNFRQAYAIWRKQAARGRHALVSWRTLDDMARGYDALV